MSTFQKQSERLASKAQTILDEAELAGRELTGAEAAEVSRLLDAAKERQVFEKQLTDLGLDKGAPGVWTDPNSPMTSSTGGPGDVFVRSKAYQSIRDATTRPQTWSTGPIEVSSSGFQMKGTLTETTAGGPGGGLVPPFYEQGVVSRLFEPLSFAQLLPSSQTSASQVRYVNEGTATSGAAGVAETGTKPESTLAYSEVSEPIKKIATVLPISDEMLEDVPSIQA
jgi:HK97 family phage major capsid protein